MREVLKNPVYIKLRLADLISNFGDILYYLALLNYVLLLEEKSNLAISIINLSEILPILISFFMGYLADRTVNKYKAILVTLLLRIGMYSIIAFIIGFSPNLIIVIIVSMFNLVSDCVGQYENGLYYPVFNRLVQDEVREKAIAFGQSLSLSMNLVFKGIGGVLILYVSFSHLALIDALSFLISMVIIISTKKEFLNYCYGGEPEQKAEKISFSSLKQELFKAIHELWRIAEIRDTLAVTPILNASLAIVTPIAVLCIADNPNFCIINPAITISLLAMCEPGGRILGSILTMFVLKRINLLNVLRIVLLTTVALLIGIIVQNIYIVLIMSFLASVWVGCMDPKMGAVILNHLDDNSLATAFGGITTYFQLGDIASKLILSVVVLAFPTSIIVLFYSLAVFATFLYITVKSS